MHPMCLKFRGIANRCGDRRVLGQRWPARLLPRQVAEGVARTAASTERRAARTCRGAGSTTTTAGEGDR